MEHFEEACSEMNFIIENMDSNFTSKVPIKLIDFFNKNKSIKYKVKLEVDKPLYEQELLEETKIFIQIIYKLFIAPKNERDQYIAESRKLFVQKNTEKWINNKYNN